MTLLQLAQQIQQVEANYQELAQRKDEKIAELEKRLKALEARFDFWLYEGDPPDDPKPLVIPEWPKILTLAGYSRPEVSA